MRIGIDLGNVIIGGDTEWFGIDFLAAPPVEGSFQSVQSLIHMGHEVFIVSKAYPRNQLKSIQWLNELAFWNTGVDRDKVFFVLRREDKVTICDAMQLHLMIDDRADIVDNINKNSKFTPAYLFTTWAQFWNDYPTL